MKHLIIKDVGPIKEIDILFNRFNFIIGPQGSGKSTIAKILSTCEWIEKEVATTRDEKAVESGESFKALIENFHNMEDYFDKRNNSYVLFETDYIFIEYAQRNLQVRLKKENNYYRQKICYIPAERNMVTLPELNGYEFKTTNIRSFLFDWYRAREFYNPENKADVLGLGVQYYYDASKINKNDRIQHVNGATYDISLSNSSSGLQSVIPLFIMLQYYSSQYFEEYDFKNSFEQEIKAKKMRSALTREIALAKYSPGYDEKEVPDLIKKMYEELHRGKAHVVQIFEDYSAACDRLLIPNRTTFIIEEPEQNLFPFTQIDLLESIVALCSKEHEHGFTITTHSPFILNYLNVLIKRYYKNIENKVCLNPELLSVFTTQEGRVINLMQTNTVTGEKSVNAEDLVEAMRMMYDEYRDLKNR